MLTIITLIIIVLTIAAYFMGRAKALSLAGADFEALHSRPSYHGFYSALWTAIIGFGVLLLLYILIGTLADRALYQKLPADLQKLPDFRQERIVEDAKTLVRGGIVSKVTEPRVLEVRKALSETYASYSFYGQWIIALGSILAAFFAFYRTNKQLNLSWRARNRTENIVRIVLLLCAVIAILTTIGIVFSLIGETLRFFSQVPFYKFLFGTHWSPLSGVFEGKLDSESVGALPLFLGTFLITFIAMLVAVPIGLMSAIYLSDYAGPAVRGWAKPTLEILAGIPTVVYGFFAAITVAPFIRGMGEGIGLDVASESALAAGIVMGIMIIPFISSLSDDVISAVPQALRDGSAGLGATKAETIVKVILPAALPGIVSAILLGMSRAVGETMIVVMAAGQGANLSFNPLEAVTTVTVQIVALITGDTEADTAAGPAFALGFTLFGITLIMNMIALRIVQKYRQKYD